MPLLPLSLSITLLLAAPAAAQAPAPDWVAQKCLAYAAAWGRATDAFGISGVNYAFIAGNENFIAGGCTEAIDICPRSSNEIHIANALTLAMMNSGAASTFLPFRCPHPEAVEGGWSGPGL